jgi:hypothetical protein
VRNGYSKRRGEIGKIVFYSLTRKGFESVAHHRGIIIRYEIEVG